MLYTLFWTSEPVFVLISRQKLSTDLLITRRLDLFGICLLIATSQATHMMYAFECEQSTSDFYFKMYSVLAAINVSNSFIKRLSTAKMKPLRTGKTTRHYNFTWFFSKVSTGPFFWSYFRFGNAYRLNSIVSFYVCRQMERNAILECVSDGLWVIFVFFGCICVCRKDTRTALSRKIRHFGNLHSNMLLSIKWQTKLTEPVDGYILSVAD